MKKELSREEELIAKVEKQFTIQASQTISFKEEKERSVFWYDPKMIPLSRPLNYKKK
jgi:hypothetical protein